MTAQRWPRPTLRPGCLEARPSGSSFEITQIYMVLCDHTCEPRWPWSQVIRSWSLGRSCQSWGSVWVHKLRSGWVCWAAGRWAPGGCTGPLPGSLLSCHEAEGEHRDGTRTWGPPWACPRIQVCPPLQLKLQDKEVGLCHFALCAGHQWCNLLGIFLLTVAVLWGPGMQAPANRVRQKGVSWVAAAKARVWT